MENTVRIDQLNRRIDYIQLKLSEISSELKEALSNREIIRAISSSLIFLLKLRYAYLS